MEDDNKKVLITIFGKNILILTVMIFYLFLMSFFYLKFNGETRIKISKILSITILFISIFIFEIAYRKDNGKIALVGIETLNISFFTLIIWTITKKYNFTYQKYILFCTIILLVYYLLKETIMHTKEKRNIFNNLSDIHEILENDPLKKEAKKRNIE